jgi:lysophospholipase L1-like esterase
MGVLVAAGTTILTLIGAEIGLRSVDYGQWRGIIPNHADPILRFTQEPGERWMPEGHTETINRFGFREREIPPKSADRVRIVAVGDSFTYGLGILHDEVWPAQLEASLNQADPRFEVFNFGMIGFNSCQIDRATELFVVDTQPDMVLVGWFPNDSERVTWNPPICGHCLPDCTLLERAGEGLTHRTRLGLVAARSVRALRDGNPSPHRPDGPEAYLVRPQGIYWRGMRASLERLVARVRAVDSRVALLLFPEGPGPINPWSGEGLEALSEELRLPILDLRGALPGDDDRFRLEDGRHLTAEANQRMGTAIAEFLVEQELVPPPPEPEPAPDGSEPPAQPSPAMP